MRTMFILLLVCVLTCIVVITHSVHTQNKELSLILEDVAVIKEVMKDIESGIDGYHR